MDPALIELAEAGNSDDVVRAVVRLRDGPVPSGLRLVSRFGDVATCRLRRGDIASLRKRVASMKAGRTLTFEPVRKKQSGFQIDTDDFLPADQRPGAELGYTGRGTVLAALDWGIDFTSPDFRNPDGSTRFLAIWDQSTREGVSNLPPFGYGRIFTRATINEALKSDNPFTTLDYAPWAYEIDDRGAHGTHVLGIAAANGRAGGPAGLASEADLVFVNLADTTHAGLFNLGDSVTILEAIDFVRRVSRQKPVCFNVSVGSHGGPHDGSTLVERGIENFLFAAPGRAVCQSAGNYYDKRIHTGGDLRGGKTVSLFFEVDESDLTGNEIEVWYSGNARVSARLIAPNGDTFGPVALEDDVPLHMDGEKVGHLYHRYRDPNNGDNHLDGFLYASAPPGRWRLFMDPERSSNGRFDAWIERDRNCTGCQSRFSREQADAKLTTGSICHARSAITVGAYNSHATGRPLAHFSSSGPSRNARRKPDLIAPGVAVLSVKSAPEDSEPGRPRFSRMSGTSMASPQVAGTVCCVFQAAQRALPIQETRRIVLGAVDRRAAALNQPHRVGAGYLDAEAAIRSAVRLSDQTVHAASTSRTAQTRRRLSAVDPFPADNKSATALNERRDVMPVQLEPREAAALFDAVLVGDTAAFSHKFDVVGWPGQRLEATSRTPVSVIRRGEEGFAEVRHIDQADTATSQADYLGLNEIAVRPIIEKTTKRHTNLESSPEQGQLSRERRWERENRAGRVEWFSSTHILLWNFAVDSTELKQKHMRALDEFRRRNGIEFVTGRRFAIIVGRASISGDEGHNIELSIGRARAVDDNFRRALASGRLHRYQSRVLGLGEQLPPIAIGSAPSDIDSPVALAQNRSVEIRIARPQNRGRRNCREIVFPNWMPPRIRRWVRTVYGQSQNEIIERVSVPENTNTDIEGDILIWLRPRLCKYCFIRLIPERPEVWAEVRPYVRAFRLRSVDQLVEMAQRHNRWAELIVRSGQAQSCDDVRTVLLRQMRSQVRNAINRAILELIGTIGSGAGN